MILFSSTNSTISIPVCHPALVGWIFLLLSSFAPYLWAQSTNELEEASEFFDLGSPVDLNDALSRFDLNLASAYLTPAFVGDLDSIEQLFEAWSAKYLNDTTLFTAKATKDTTTWMGNMALVRYVDKASNRIIMGLGSYWHYRDNQVIVNHLVFSEQGTSYVFPTLVTRLLELHKRLTIVNQTDNTNYLSKLALTNTIIDTSLKVIELNAVFYPNPTEALSNLYGDKAWFHCALGQGAQAIAAANTALDMYPDNTWINTNLALGLLISGDTASARQIYLAYKDQPLRDGTFKEVFIEDLDAVIEAGVSIPDADNIRAILNE